MGNFLSAVVLKDGNILYDISHDYLYTISSRLCPNVSPEDLCRIEYIPPYKDITDTSKWKLVISEPRIPRWLDKEKVKVQLNAIVNSLIITGNHDVVNGGDWIAISSANIKKIENCFVRCVEANTCIEKMGANSVVWYLKDTSTVVKMCKNSRIYSLLEKSEVGTMRDNAHIGSMHGNTKVHRMFDTSTIGTVFSGSDVLYTYDLACTHADGCTGDGV